MDKKILKIFKIKVLQVKSNIFTIYEISHFISFYLKLSHLEISNLKNKTVNKMECQYCKNIFTTKVSLYNHQKTAKYCLDIRNVKVQEYSCKNCGRKFNRESNMNRHYKICKVDEKAKLENRIIEIEKERDEYKIVLKEKEEIYEKQIEEQKIQIKELQNKLENLAKEAIRRPTTSNTTTTNNTTNNILNLAPLDMNILRDQLSNVINTKMTEEHVLEGQEGIAKLVSCCFTTDDGKKLITCTDISRGVWKSKDVNGNIIKDYKANNIAKVIKPLATLKANELIEIDDIKRKKIYEVFSIRKRRKERIETDKFEVATQRGYKKNSIEYNMCEDRMHKRSMEQSEDDELEKEIVEEFRKSNDMYLLDLPEDIDKPYKMYLGKKDIVEMGDDSSKFSNKLITLM